MRIAIIPARGGSKRIPGKNIVDFCGRPILSYSLAAARQSGLFDAIHVSTDDEATAEVAARFGHAPEFRRDPALADDHTPLLPVLRWVVERFAAAGRRFDTVCAIMPAAPLIDADDLARACALFEGQGGGHTVVAVTALPCPVEWAMRLGPGGALEPIEPGKAEIRSQDLPKAYIDCGAFYFCGAAELLAPSPQRRDLLGYVVPRHKAVDIDEPEDLELAERLYRGRP